MEIPIPYHMREEDLRLEPEEVLKSSRLNADPYWDFNEELEWLQDNANEEAYELVFRGFVILRHKFPEASFNDCWVTSMIWYFG